jgi:hypothetical protein
VEHVVRGVENAQRKQKDDRLPPKTARCSLRTRRRSDPPSGSTTYAKPEP